jgi:hypothetical protein
MTTVGLAALKTFVWLATIRRTGSIYIIRLAAQPRERAWGRVDLHPASNWHKFYNPAQPNDRLATPAQVFGGCSPGELEFRSRPGALGQVAAPLDDWPRLTVARRPEDNRRRRIDARAFESAPPLLVVRPARTSAHSRWLAAWRAHSFWPQFRLSWPAEPAWTAFLCVPSPKLGWEQIVDIVPLGPALLLARPAHRPASSQPSRAGPSARRTEVTGRWIVRGLSRRQNCRQLMHHKFDPGRLLASSILTKNNLFGRPPPSAAAPDRARARAPVAVRRVRRGWPVAAGLGS